MSSGFNPINPPNNMSSGGDGGDGRRKLDRNQGGGGYKRNISQISSVGNSENSDRRDQRAMSLQHPNDSDAPRQFIESPSPMPLESDMMSRYSGPSGQQLQSPSPPYRPAVNHSRMTSEMPIQSSPMQTSKHAMPQPPAAGSWNPAFGNPRPGFNPNSPFINSFAPSLNAAPQIPPQQQQQQGGGLLVRGSPTWHLADGPGQARDGARQFQVPSRRPEHFFLESVTNTWVCNAFFRRLQTLGQGEQLRPLLECVLRNWHLLKNVTPRVIPGAQNIIHGTEPTDHNLIALAMELLGVHHEEAECTKRRCCKPKTPFRGCNYGLRDDLVGTNPPHNSKCTNCLWRNAGSAECRHTQSLPGDGETEDEEEVSKSRTSRRRGSVVEGSGVEQTRTNTRPQRPNRPVPGQMANTYTHVFESPSGPHSSPPQAHPRRRRQKGNLFQSGVHRRLHFGDDADLGSSKGIQEQILELNDVIGQLSERLLRAAAGKELEELDASEDETAMKNARGQRRK
ncbi:hypothetical protein HYALB_00000975 [Hymenoscyphus albidus]|uniref:Uncharacterized protein n=1 Tax=Hymenoscyphus albidus TaxID=595503 RepID=A0A9N9QC22_9HELO|nr:hypothetical protein HYALB_00000975 [Hymenoscyphus albidus]